ncbi:Predicted arabinose efflux permease, MFS family [Phyllobacterium sp. YR620]|uniref:MFS transporter n=1 Tax=Phyllobacterium sp. YR620 TaxID=1881066 RepID=UPI000886AEAA|nr:MFS transporter [Phyllobacterium sp. YR620]SDO85623.1 Predicted arabinose efflux permease, MFS family [Phyllobacterium sp. YR620]
MGIDAMRDVSAAGDSWPVVVGAIAAQVIGGLVPQMAPFLVSGMMDGLSLSERDAGFVAFVEFVTLAATAILIAPVLPRFSYRRVCLAAVALTLLAQGASIFSTSLGSLAFLRGFAGVGEGAIYAVSLSIVASRCRNPDKVYGYFQVVWALGSVGLFAIGGQLTATFAHRGIFAFIAGVTLALSPLLLLIPNDRARNVHRSAALVVAAPPLIGVMTFTAIVLYLAASAAVYTFSAPLGERAGLDTSQVSYALTIASLIGLLGAGAATVLNLRWGRAIPITGFCIGFAIITIALCFSQSAIVYLVALIASVVIYYFSIPYLFGLSAALDRSGRWAAAAGSAYLLGFAAGPLIAGATITAAGYAGLAAACVAITAGAWALAMAVNRRLRETTGTGTTEAPA